MAGAPAACASQREPRTGKESSSRSSQQEEAAEREYGHQQCAKKTSPYRLRGSPKSSP